MGWQSHNTQPNSMHRVTVGSDSELCCAIQPICGIHKPLPKQHTQPNQKTAPSIDFLRHSNRQILPEVVLQMVFGLIGFTVEMDTPCSVATAFHC